MDIATLRIYTHLTSSTLNMGSFEIVGTTLHYKLLLHMQARRSLNE